MRCPHLSGRFTSIGIIFALAEMGLRDLERPCAKSIYNTWPVRRRDGNHIEQLERLAARDADSLRKQDRNLQIRAELLQTDQAGGVRAIIGYRTVVSWIFLDVSLHHDAFQHLARDGQLPVLPP